MKKATVLFNAVGTGAGRCMGGGLTLLAVILILRSKWELRREHVLYLLVIMVFGFVWPFTMQPWLINRHQDSAFFGMMVSLVPLSTILASIPLLGVLPTARQLLGVIGGLGFMGLLAFEGFDRSIPIQHFLLAVSIPVCYAVSNTLVKRWLSEPPAIQVTAAALLPSGLALLLLSPVLDDPVLKETTTAEMWQAIAALAVLAVMASAVSILVFYHLIQTRGPLFAGMVTYVVPVGALGWGWMDGEPIALKQVIALVGILSMVVLVQTSSSTKVKPAPTLDEKTDP